MTAVSLSPGQLRSFCIQNDERTRRKVHLARHYGFLAVIFAPESSYASCNTVHLSILMLLGMDIIVVPFA
jgi:hypothetical protein